MQAVDQDVYGSTEVLQLTNINRPQITDDDVLVRVRAAAVQIGDWHVMTGEPYLMRIMGAGFRAPKARVRGMDVAGTIEAVGKNVTRFRAGDNVFATPEDTRRTLVDQGLIVFDSTQYDPDDPSNAALIIWITEIDPFDEDMGRMPFDAPMPDKDIRLLRDWIAAGAPGAQCNPDSNNGKACNNTEVVQCNADWSFGERVMLCSNGCVQGVCQ